ncbi:tRNA uracil 4-sulfurtransferase ThiI [Mycoplasmopsis gallinarum]|uniref:Probable tRNA sulfurtransferase n=1 Tax=Mycoplasmopsis gallinarum TaxID=29557 RepID=A0A168RDZ4_9BACT|nr:tRNA S(4)U 4-thiouridine synthase [Mycoplasmopsis gallinarum]
MYSKILMRYGELTLKNKNRNLFVDYLNNNIRRIFNLKPEIEYDRMFIPYSEDNLEKMQYLFGISSYSPVVVCEKDLEIIKKTAAALLIKNQAKTFKVEARRSDKNYPYKSQEINMLLGEYLLNNIDGIKVDVHNPECIIAVEIRKNNAYIFDKYIMGLGGLPVGSAGKTLHLMSGGIDSPVAAFELMKRGLKVEFFSFITPPQTDNKTIDKMQRLVKVLTKYQGNSNLFLVDYAKPMNYISLVSNEAFKINLMRRSFYRIATQFAKKQNIFCLSNGENLGQVASQTLESMYTINHVTDLLVLRPLISNDKNETINIAKRIGTYEISIEKASETCELFAPKKPVTKPKLAEAEKLENELNLLNELELEVLNNEISLVQIK